MLMLFQLYFCIIYCKLSINLCFFPIVIFSRSSLLIDLIIRKHHLYVLYVSDLSFGLRGWSDFTIDLIGIISSIVVFKIVSSLSQVLLTQFWFLFGTINILSNPLNLSVNSSILVLNFPNNRLSFYLMYIYLF